MNEYKRRLRKLEEKTGGRNFSQRMEEIFSTGSLEKLTSGDVLNLKKNMPDKYEFLVSEIYKLTSANI